MCGEVDRSGFECMPGSFGAVGGHGEVAAVLLAYLKKGLRSPSGAGAAYSMESHFVHDICD